MVLVIIHMRVVPEKRKELSQTLNSLLNSVRTEKGCGSCDFFHDMEDENVFCLLIEWDTRINYENHRRSECFKVLRGAMNLLDGPGEIISFSIEHPAEIEEIGPFRMCKRNEHNN